MLSVEKGMEKEYALYETVEKEAGQLIMNKRKMFKPVCQCRFLQWICIFNAWYSRRNVYSMFATARISGWCARLEELVNAERLFVLLISM